MLGELSQSCSGFKKRGIEVIAVSPDSAASTAKYMARFAPPFRVFPDPGGVVLNALGQQVQWLHWGRLPGLLAIQRDGVICYSHRGRTMRDLPDLRAAAAALLTSGHDQA